MMADNGMSWQPVPGVVPVIRRVREKSPARWVLGKMIMPPGEMDEKISFARVIQLARLAVEGGGAERMEVWSEKAVLPLDGFLLLGDSEGAVHRWVLTREMCAESEASAAMWMEEPMGDAERLAVLGLLGKTCFGMGMSLPGGGGGVVVADFGWVADLEELPWLDKVAKAQGVALLVVADLLDVRGEPMECGSYGEVAMQVAIERGLDLKLFAGTIAVVDDASADGPGWRGRILRAEGDGTPIPVAWRMEDGK